MRVEIVDGMCYRHSIDSRSLPLIGQWFAEKAALLMSANTRVNHPARIDIWPEYSEEVQLVGNTQRTMMFTQDDILAFTEHLLNVSTELGKRETDGSPALP
jgi:hypothetical protein